VHQPGVDRRATEDRRQRHDRQQEQHTVGEQGVGREASDDTAPGLAGGGEHLVADGAPRGRPTRHDTGEGVARQLRRGEDEPARFVQRDPHHAPVADERPGLKDDHQREPPPRDGPQSGHGVPEPYELRPDEVEADRRRAHEDQRLDRDAEAGLGLRGLGRRVNHDRAWGREAAPAAVLPDRSILATQRQRLGGRRIPRRPGRVLRGVGLAEPVVGGRRPSITRAVIHDHKDSPRSGYPQGSACRPRALVGWQGPAKQRRRVRGQGA